MKTVIIKNYKQGLCSFLDEKGINWKNVAKPGEDNDIVEIEYKDAEQLFELAFEFGEFYSNPSNY